MALRPYQLLAVALLREHYGQRPCLVLPTGAGKTHVFCEVIRRFKGRALVVAHRRELIQQAHDRLAAFGVDAGVIMAGVPPSDSRVQVASVQTLARRAMPETDMVIVDECHHAAAGSYRRIFDTKAFVWGCTATPFRLDGRGLAPMFNAILSPVSVRDLCDQGILVEPLVYAPPGPDLKGVRTVAGDYHEGQLAERMATLTGDIVEHWKRHGRGKTIAFAVNIEHSQAIARAFADQGIRAAHLDGTAAIPERARVLAQLRSGEIDVLSNCALVAEGWDLPALSTAILARPTKSLALHLQQIGRIMRSADGKDGAIVLDHAGNHHRHGCVTDPIDYCLDGKVKKPELGAAPFKTCKACFAIIPATSDECPECGAPIEAQERVITQAKGELVRFSTADRRAAYTDFVKTASRCGYKLGWAKVRFKDQFHVWPRNMGDIDALYTCTAHEWEQRTYGTICARCLRKPSLTRSPTGYRIEA